MKISGGDKFEQAIADIVAKLQKASTLSVGFMSESTYPDGTSVPLVAAVQEFGAPSRNIPPRPFFRQMIQEKSPEWPEAIAEAVKAAGYDTEIALNQTGEVIKAELQDSIRNFNEPPLSPLTLMLRGMRSQAKYRDMPFGQLVKAAQARLAAGLSNFNPSTKPLIDSGTLINSITTKVE